MADSYQEFLDEKHAKFVTPDSVTSEVVQEIMHKSMVSKQKIIAGEMNEVYEVRLSSGETVILRISRSKHPRFEIEKWAIEQARQLNVPAPEVYGVTSRQLQDQNLAFNIEEKLEGEFMSDLGYTHNNDSPEVRKWCQEIGAIISRIHQIKTEGYHFLQDNLKGEFDTWEAWVADRVKDRDYYKKGAVHAGLEADIIDRGLEYLQTVEPVVEPRLLHHDVSPKHFLICDNTVSGIIDFENASSGDPVSDLAWWDFWNGWARPVEWLVEGYEDKALIEEKFEERLKAYRIFMGIGLLTWYMEQENPHSLQHVKKELLKDLADN